MNSKLLWLLSCLTMILFSACTGVSTHKPSNLRFSNHPKLIHAAISDPAGQQKAIEKLDKKKVKGKNQILYCMERGRISALNGDQTASINDFELAIQAIAALEKEALVNSSNTGKNIAAALSNDRVLAYVGRPFERTLLHHYQAVNYLSLGDMEKALVEIRRADFEQKSAEEKHNKELIKAQKEAETKKVTLNGDFLKKLHESFKVMDAQAASIKSGFQNPYVHYFSGLVYRAAGKKNEAYVSFKKALEAAPYNKVLQKELVAEARLQGRHSDLADFQKRFDKTVFKTSKKAGESRFILILEEDLIPAKKQVKIPFPISGNILSVAFPIYDEPSMAAQPKSIFCNGGAIGETEPLCDLSGMAIKDLKDQIPIISLRQAIRVAAKTTIAKQAGRRGGVLGWVGSNVYNNVSEKADLRAWLTLPRHVQVFKTTLKSGTHQVSLKDATGAAKDIQVATQSGKTTVVFLTKIQDQVYQRNLTF